MLKLFEGVMRRSDQFPPVLPRVIEGNSSLGELSRIKLAIGCKAIIIYTLHDKVLVREVVLVIGVSRVRLNLIV